MAEKYTQKEIDALGAKGQAFKNPDGSFSYPVADVEDLQNAIHAVGRGNAAHEAIRKYIMGRADALGEAKLIPDTWNADGSLKQANDSTPAAELRAAPTPQDSDVSKAIVAAHNAVSAALVAQHGDPDNGKDPDDAAVMAHLTAAKAALDQAVVAQAKDQTPEPGARSRVPVQVKRGTFSNLREQHPPIDTQVSVRADTDALASFVGYASRTGVAYDVTDWLGSYRETIEPGSFAKTLRETDNVPLLFNHDGIPIASTAGKTMRLSEDGDGLRTEADLDRRQGLTNDLCIALERRDLTKMSFAFKAVRQAWSPDYADRSVSEVELFDTSIVTYPASGATSAGLRSELVDVIGREGRSLMHALAERRAAADPGDLDKAIAVMRAADEWIVARHGYHGRARTFLVAQLLADLRAGAVLSSENQALLTNAFSALGEAHDHLSALAGKAGMLDNNEDEVPDDDGAEPRSISLALARAQADALRLHRPRIAVPA